jgi:hypothetical protein
VLGRVGFTWWLAAEVINPAVHFALSGAGPHAWFGWPDVPQLEKLITDPLDNLNSTGGDEVSHPVAEPFAEAAGERGSSGASSVCSRVRNSPPSFEGGTLARHVQLRPSSMRRIRSTRSRVEKGFVTYASAPSESPFSR